MEAQTTMLRLVPREELESRLARFQARLRAAEIDVALIIQGADLIYLAGTRQQAHLIVPAEGSPLLLARKSLSRAERESAWPTQPLRSLRDLPKIVAELTGAAPRRVGLELDVMPVMVFRQYEGLWAEAATVDVGAILRDLRAVKSPWELDRIREAGLLIDRMLQAVPDILREGITEVEFAGRLEAVGRALGNQGLTPMRHWNQQPFYGALVAGPNAAEATYFDGPIGGLGVSVASPINAGMRMIRRGEPIVIDYMVGVDGYLSDQTRIFSLGPLPQYLVDAHEAMRDVYATVARAARPGVTGGDVYDIAVARAAELGMADMFMGSGEGRVGFVAHGIGLEVDELPLLAKGYQGMLEPGMVLALEPKAIFPSVGGVGIENVTVVTETGLESLCVSPEEIIVL